MCREEMLKKGRGADKPGGWRESGMDAGRREGRRDGTVDSDGGIKRGRQTGV